MNSNQLPEDPFDDESKDPFAQLNHLFETLDQQGTGGFDQLSNLDPTAQAREIARSIAAEGQPEANVDPVMRMEYEQLARVAQLQVENHTGLLINRGQPLVIEPLTRGAWAERSITALEPLLTKMTSALNQDLPENFTLDLPEEIAAQLPPELRQSLGQMFSTFAPMMTSITTGTMVGRLAQRSLGSYDLPIPRADDHLLLVAPNIEEFGNDWSLRSEDLRLWVCLHETLHHALFGIPHVRKAISDLLSRHAAGFQNDPDTLQRTLEESGIDLQGDPENPPNFSQMLDPETILGAAQSPDQKALLPYLEAQVAAIIGYVDHLMDEIGTGLIANYPMITEALRRRRVETHEADRFVEKILGLNLTQDQVDRGASFVEGIIQWGSHNELNRLWEEARFLPTPNEIDNPRLWLARISLPEDPTKN